MSEYPGKLGDIVEFFDNLSDIEKRENLVAYADEVDRLAPDAGEVFDLEDVRRDQECTDTVGVYLKVGENGEAYFKMTLGKEVQTLTRAMAAILCEGLNGVSVEEVIGVEQDFVPKIVGGELVRVRSQTVYYVLSRMKGVCKVYMRKHGVV